MKKQINDLLLKMQSGENCIGETANALLLLCNSSLHVKEQCKISFEDWYKSEGYTSKWDGYFKNGKKSTYWIVKGKYLQAMKV